MKEPNGKVRFSASLPNELHSKAVQEARTMGVTLNTVLLWAVREHVEKREAEVGTRVTADIPATP